MMTQKPKFYLLLLLISISVYADSNSDLLQSASSGDLEGVKKSLSKNADINCKDSVGTSALMFAANNDHFPIVKYLVENKADVLAKNTSGWTAAIMAGARGNTLIKEYLEDAERKIIISRSSGVILAVAGNVSVDNKQLKAGDIVLENQTIYVGRKSFCDLQVKESLSTYTIRIKENSLLALKFKETPDENVYTGLLKYGQAIFKVGKVFSGEKIQAATPTVIAAVRGTIFDVSVADDGSSNLGVYEGFVNSRIRAPEAEDDKSIEDTVEMKQLTANLERNSQLVPHGYSYEATAKKQKEILSKMDADNLVKRAKRKEYSTAPVEEVNLKCSEKPKLKKGIEEQKLTANLKESESLVGVEGADLRNTWDREQLQNIIDKRKENRDRNQSEKKEVAKQPEKIKLKNGTYVTGSIYQVDNKFILISEEGEKTIPNSEIDTVYFQ